MFLSASAHDSLKVWKEAAAQHYKAANYEAAIQAYNNMLPLEEESPQIYYNLGNAYYKDGQIAKAILNYERALLLKPNYEDAAFNLEMARAATIDKIDEMKSFFLADWVNSVSNWMSSNSWAMLSIGSFTLMLCFIFAYVFMKKTIIRKTGFFGALFLLLISVASFGLSSVQKSKATNRLYAIVMAPSTTATSTPDENGTKLFVLHEGTKVKIKDKLNIWLKIQLSDGNEGWVKLEDIEQI